MIAEQNQITIQFTPEQQQLIYRLSGFARPSLSLSKLQTAALSMAAVAAGSDVLPVSNSAATIQQMLGPSAADGAYLLRLPLTNQQKDLLHEVTRISLSSIALAPDEWNPIYHETWQPGANEIRVGQSTMILTGGDGSEQTMEGCATKRQADATESVFGTGRHPATQLALEFLESTVKAGDRVLDVGTGSGILAVAAARLGATAVTAVDTDQAAVAKAEEVVRTNNLQGVVTVVLGGAESVDGVFDTLVANIFTPIILLLASDFSRLVRPFGSLIISGVVSARADEVTKGLAAAGFELRDQRSRDVWQGLVFTRLAE